jgi:hypothetical protein
VYAKASSLIPILMSVFIRMPYSRIFSLDSGSARGSFYLLFALVGPCMTIAAEYH